VIAILIAGLLYWVFGALWYSPFLFGSSWQKLVGLTPDKMKTYSKKDMIVSYTGTFLCAIVAAYAVERFMNEMVVLFWLDLFRLAAIAGAGFVLATQLPSYLFLKKPLKLFVIDAGYHVCGIVLCFAVIFVSKKF
jgi:hypothetical protein